MLQLLSLPVDLQVRDGFITVRRAGMTDLDDIIRLLGDGSDPRRSGE